MLQTGNIKDLPIQILVDECDFMVKNLMAYNFRTRIKIFRVYKVFGQNSRDKIKFYRFKGMPESKARR